MMPIQAAAVDGVARFKVEQASRNAVGTGVRVELDRGVVFSHHVAWIERKVAIARDLPLAQRTQHDAMRVAGEALRVIRASRFLLLAAPGDLVENVLRRSAWRKDKAFRDRIIHAHGHPGRATENNPVSRLVRPLNGQNNGI